MTNEIKVSQVEVTRALNRCADLINDAADLSDTGTRDALNLLVNAAIYVLFDNPYAELDEVVENNYDDPYEEVIGWIT